MLFCVSLLFGVVLLVLQTTFVVSCCFMICLFGFGIGFIGLLLLCFGWVELVCGLAGLVLGCFACCYVWIYCLLSCLGCVVCLSLRVWGFFSDMFAMIIYCGFSGCYLDYFFLLWLAGA